MKTHLKKALLILFLVVTMPIFATSANNRRTRATDLLDTVNQKDLWAIRDWLKQKRLALNSKGGDLAIAGDIRAEYRNVHEALGSLNLTGGVDSPSGWSNNLYYIDFRLYLDYKADKTWASVKLDFDQSGGSFNGEANNIALNRANMGYHLFDDGMMRLDLLIDRQRAFDIYDSEIQFNSTLDGFTTTFGAALIGLGDFSLRGGGYIVDAGIKHPVWILPSALYDILDTGLYFEYAFADWHKGTSEVIVNTANGESINSNRAKFDYFTNQFILGYHFPELLKMNTRLFGGLVWNAMANSNVVTVLSSGKIHNNPKNIGGWVALQIGSVERAGDWAFQAQWQIVEPLALPDFDVSGIGTGNSTSSSLFGFNTFSSAVNFPGNGNVNYNGWEIDLLYSITNELVIEARFQRAQEAVKNIGLPLNYTNFMLSFIYGF